MTGPGPAPRQPSSAVPLLVLLAASASGVLALLGLLELAAIGGGLAILMALFDAFFPASRQRSKTPAEVVRAAIGSTARGYVELRGTAQPLTAPIKCPVCGVNCLWHGPGRTPRGARALGSIANFLISDDSGTCEVSPTVDASSGGPHAHVIVGDMVTVRGLYEPFDESRTVPAWLDPAMMRSEASQRVREWVEKPQMREVLDANRDGRLENREMRAAALAAEAQVRRETAGRIVEVAGKIRVPGLEDLRPFTMTVARQS